MGVELNIRAWWVGTKDSINREGYGALPGRIGGLVRDVKAFYFDEPVVGMVNFGYIEGRGRKGRRALVTGDGQLGRDFSMYDSALRYAAKILSGEIKGDFREAIEQAKQWKKIEEQILSLKDGESFAFLTPKGTIANNGVAFTSVKRVGNKFSLTSRLLPPEIDNDNAIQLFKEFTKDKGELVSFGNEKNKDNALYMGVKGVEINVRSKEFEVKLRRVLIDEKKSNVRMLPAIREKDIFVPRFLMKTIPVRDFKIDGLQDFRVVAFGGTAQLNTLGMIGGHQLKKTEESERTEVAFAGTDVEEKEVVRKIVVEEEVFEERGESVFAGEQKSETVEVVDGKEAVILDEKVATGQSVLVGGKKAVVKSFEVPKFFDEKIERSQEIEFRLGLPRSLALPCNDIASLCEGSNAKFVKVTESFDGEKKEAVISDVINNQREAIEDEVTVESRTEKKEIDTVIEENGEELPTGDSEDLSEEVEFTSEQVSVDEVVDYGRGEVMGMTEIKLETAEEGGIGEEVVIFNARGLVVKKPEIFGELVIPAPLFIRLKVPKVVFNNHIFADELWKAETGAKMMADISYASGQSLSYLTIFVPAIIFWVDEVLTSCQE